MKRIIIVGMLVFVSIASIAQDKWNLERCVEHALQNNINIKQSELNVALVEQNLTQSKLAQIPTLNASSNQNFSFGRSINPFTNTFATRNTAANSVGLSGSIALFNGFQVQNNIKLQKINLIASEFDLEATRNSIALSVANLYLTAIFSKEQYEIARNRVALTQKQVDRTQKLVDAGALSQDNLLNLKAQLASDQTNVVAANNQVQTSMVNLQQALQLPYSETFSIEYIDLPTNIESNPMTVEVMYNESLKNMPEIKSAEMRVIAAERSLKVSKGGLYPRLMAQGSYSTLYSDQALDYTQVQYELDGITPIGFVANTFDTVYQPNLKQVGTPPVLPLGNQFRNNLGQSVSLSLSIPIFNQGQVKSNIERSKINIQQSQLNVDAAKNQLYQNITTAYQNYKSAMNSYEANKANFKAQSENYDFATKRFEAGLLNTVDYLNIKNNLENAESNLLQSKYEVIFREEILQFYNGKKITK